jgi:hypothetical protein
MPRQIESPGALARRSPGGSTRGPQRANFHPTAQACAVGTQACPHSVRT